MARNYAETVVLISQKLQDTGLATYDTTEIGYMIEEGLKDIDFNRAYPHFVDVIYKIESRTGNETAGTASSLTDTTKLQFLAGDVQKTVRNTTQNKWAVIEVNSSTSVNTLSADIMAVGDNYEIYDKYCTSDKQIYIGSVAGLGYLWIESVEYPVGTPRNYKLYQGGTVLEIMRDTVGDSDSTLDVLADVDVLVRFAKPHRLLEGTSVSGELTADESLGDTTIAVDGLETTGTYERGDEFNLQFHRSTYTLTADTTMTAGAGNLSITPGLEAAATDNDDITFIVSTLTPDAESIFADYVAAKTVQSDAIKYINKTNENAWSDYTSWANRILAGVRNRTLLVKPLTSRKYQRT